MKVIDIYKQYFSAQCIFQGVERKAAMVCLTARSENGMITYEVGVSFFPHRDEEDFAISYDAYASKVLFYAKGRRSKKRDEQFLAQVQSVADEIARQMQGVIFWDKPIGGYLYG